MSEPAPWLLLFHQLPAKPAYNRVKIWRRLQGIGAVAVKKAVYVLPNNETAAEDFAWLRREIEDLGGEALIAEARLVEGLTDAEVRAKFDAARDADYAALADDIRKVQAAAPDVAAAEAPKLRARFEQIVALDFFGAPGGAAASGLLAALEPNREEPAMTITDARHGALTSRVWVTRERVAVDRIASAWLIRRFIDQAARFKFVPAKGYEPEPGELRFDMFEAEFTHEGEACTFEVLLKRTGLDDPALTAIAEIVHDIDLKDGKYGRAETAGVARMLAGIAAPGADDPQRLAKGGDLFDGLYQSFKSKA